MKLKRYFQYSIALLFIGIFLSCQNNKKEYITNQGSVFGTYYNIIYDQAKGEDLHSLITSTFDEFNNSLSTFSPHSIISKINQNDDEVITDNYFNEMYNMAQIITEVSDGAFDITVGPLVNAWGFGTATERPKNKLNIDSILNFIGYEKLSLENNKLIKEDSRIELDASAIAKGQACDVIGKLLEDNGCKNYMVEIGGEIYCKGLNAKGEKWRIGIDTPIDNSIESSGEFQAIIEISNVGMATSGNYRQFYIVDGKRYAHTIDPRTGYPVDHNLLSTTVVASSCMEADAFATAFMVLGVDESLRIANDREGLECFLIYSDDNGLIQTSMSGGFEQYLLDDE